MNPPATADSVSPPSEPPDRVELDASALEKFELTPLGFPADAKLLQIVVTPLLAAVRLDLSSLAPHTSPADLHPAIRRLALRLDEDCKQMGLVVPVVVVPQLPDTTPEALRKTWQQIDADTDLNAGEFAVRVPSEAKLIDRLMEELTADRFNPPSLNIPIRPCGDDDYRQALRESAADLRSAEHTRLLQEILYPNWTTPDRIRSQLQELATAMATETSAEKALHPTTPEVHQNGATK
jgi:hypothetical protein